MKNKGFTLIELLAVIVILAIIALIATPIVLNIINDARESSYKRSIDNYGKAVEQAIANYQIYNPNNDAVGKFTTSKPLESINGLNINYEGTEVNCDAIYVYEDGNIYMEQCSVGDHEVDYTYGKAEILVTPAITSETGNVPTGEYVPGDEYTIYIGGEDRTFFILSENSDSTKVDLIMNKNIGDQVAWCGDETLCKTNGNWDNTKGPLTANAYLASQTSSWEVTPYLPTKAQIKGAYPGERPIWQYDYLSTTTHSVSDAYGYWTASPVDGDSRRAWLVSYIGSVDDYSVEYDFGVRPVITLRKSFLN